MARTLTSRNWDHPHYKLKEFLANHKARLRALSAADFKSAFDSELDTHLYDVHNNPDTKMDFIDWPKERHTQLAWMLTVWERRYKAIWLERVGWPFEDIYDSKKYGERIAAMQKAEAEAIKAAQKEQDEKDGLQEEDPISPLAHIGQTG